MSSLLKFFIKINKLKKTKRRGWILYGIKEPATTADHVFRAAILAWSLNKKKGLNEGKIVKSVLVHHLPDIYAGGEDIPYDSLLPRELSSKKAKTKIGEILQNVPQISAGAEKKRAKDRYQAEKKALHRLLLRLPDDIRKELMDLWEEFNNKRTKVGKFAWEAAKTESYLQALQYWKSQGKIQHQLWNHWTKRVLRDSVISRFKREIDKFFFNPRKKRERNAFTEMLDFIIEIGKLKRLKRTGWILRQVKNPETVAQHTFQVTIISWLLGEIKGLNTDRIVKIALAHDLCEVYAGSHVPYDPMLVLKKEEVRKIMEKPVRMSQSKWLEWLLQKRTKEWKSIVKLTSHLSKPLQDEIIGLWIDCEEGLTKEGRFVSQVNKMTNLFQAIEYWKRDKKFPITPCWIFIKERIDDPLLLKFIEELDKEFAIAKQGRKKR